MLKRLGMALLALLVSTGASRASQNDADMKELKSYRLTMEGVNKLSVVMRTLFDEMKKDPKAHELMKLTADIKALEEKDERTEAEDERLQAMTEKKEELEDALQGGLQLGNQDSLDEMEASVKQSEPMMRALRAGGLTPREYAKLSLAMLTSAMYAGMQKSGLLKELPKEASPENVKFVLDHEAELAALQKEWAAWSKDIE